MCTNFRRPVISVLGVENEIISLKQIIEKYYNSYLSMMNNTIIINNQCKYLRKNRQNLPIQCPHCYKTGISSLAVLRPLICI